MKTIGIDTIKQLEKHSRALEPSAGERAFLFEKITQYTNSFLENIGRVPAYQATKDEGIGLYDSPISEEPNLVKPEPKRTWTANPPTANL